ncbi:MAG TPA: hypothetical protein VK745_00525 [Polyangiaceae bacterium]|jgi:hypothetical protein|nr:hypothetical protein [Polyangiaceae bacterium]
MASHCELIASSMAALGVITILLALKGGTTEQRVPFEHDHQSMDPLAQHFGAETGLEIE